MVSICAIPCKIFLFEPWQFFLLYRYFKGGPRAAFSSCSSFGRGHYFIVGGRESSKIFGSKNGGSGGDGVK